jgi:uncharacterized protein (DUF1778 family)
MAAAKRVERLELRTTSDQKRFIKRAAEPTGTTVAAYTLFHVQEAAAATIRDFESLFLRDEAREVFVQAAITLITTTTTMVIRPSMGGDGNPRGRRSEPPWFAT